MLRLFTFGGLGIEPDDGSTTPRLRPPRLALLAVLAAAGDRGVSRDRLASLFWPEADEPRARHSLRQARYALRNELGREVIRAAGTVLALDDAAISADIIDFRSALAAGNPARAVELVRGSFLDGFYLAGASTFERWVEEERARVSDATTSALLSMAAEATQRDQRDAAVDWWRRLTLVDPLSGRYALGYLKALAAHGNRAEALAFARQHEVVVRRELEADPDPAIRRLEADLRAMPTPEVSRPIVVQTTTDRPSERLHAPPVADAHPIAAAPAVRKRRALVSVAALGVVALIMTAAPGWVRRADSVPVLAVGFIREEAADSTRPGRVLTDMLATNLSRVEGLSVLANSRLLELMRPGVDSAARYADAARRAGAWELLEGRVTTTRDAPVALEIRRVDLRTGILKEVYRVTAMDRYGLVDSVTRVVALRFQLPSPRGSIADASTTSPLAYRLYEEGLRAYFRFDMDGAQRLMRAALEEDSTFAMAAYYEALLASQRGTDLLPDGRHVTDAVRAALRLALRAPERERLTITANLLSFYVDPRALAMAESLATRYPHDPRAFVTVGKTRGWVGDWAGAVWAIERAITLDSIGERRGSGTCHLCRDFTELAGIYFWWDSLPAAVRTLRRYAAADPESTDPLYHSSVAAARLGDSAFAYGAYRRMSSQHGQNWPLKLNLDLTLERYAEVEREVRPLLASSSMAEWGVGAWNLLIALRNQGRLREANQLHRSGTLPGFPTPTLDRTPDAFNEGILAVERGEPRVAAKVFGDRVHLDMSWWMPGVQARHKTWNATLQGMALAAAGDTTAVRQLADSVEIWGRASAYGRDRKAHHYLRGLVLAAANRHEDAVREFRAAIYSPSLGFTRVNYELARCLMHLGRPQEAVAALQPALRGEIDASNLYITRTDLHELLAQAFDSAGRSDSAAVHYQAVVRAWRRADPSFYNRRDRAHAWLARHLKGSAVSH